MARGQRKPEKWFWIWVLALAAGLYALVGAQLALFYANNLGALADMPPRLRTNLLIFLGVAVASLIPVLVLGMRVWFRRYVLPVHRISEDVEALLYGSPVARPGDHEDDAAGLTELLNALMDRYESDEVRLEARLADARGELEAETSRLASLLDALSEGVIACTEDGRVFRYNAAAQRLLDEHVSLGVGRPITEIIDQAMFDYARETLPDRLGKGARHPFVSFDCEREKCGRNLVMRLAPLLVYGGRLEGYVLTMLTAEPGEYLPQSWLRVQAPAGVEAAAPPEAPLLQRPLSALRYVVFDTETTGLDPAAGDEVIALGAVVVADGRIVAEESFDRLVDPRRRIRASAQRVHGITAEALAGRPTLPDVLPEFAAFTRGAVLVAHHAAFDLRFLERHRAVAPALLEQPVLDTMLLSAALHPSQPSQSLDTLAGRYGLSMAERHSALGDARIAAELLLRLLPLLERRGILTLEQAIAASRRTPLARLSYR